MEIPGKVRPLGAFPGFSFCGAGCSAAALEGYFEDQAPVSAGNSLLASVLLWIRFGPGQSEPEARQSVSVGSRAVPRRALRRSCCTVGDPPALCAPEF